MMSIFVATRIIPINTALSISAFIHILILHFFTSEEIIYGNRSPEINCFLPNAFWQAIEHNLLRIEIM